MSHPKDPQPALFFASFIIREDLAGEVSSLSQRFFEAPVTLLGPYPFHALFYEKEMGKPLQRWVVFSQALQNPEKLVFWKHKAYAWEEETRQGEQRTWNIDPGYLNYHQVVVATFKDYAHRIYIGNGVFAHLEYLYRKGEPEILPWTYPDFRRDDLKGCFRQGRLLYDQAIKSRKREP